ncbi:MAG: hypothetical protein EBR82_85225 [Caulobacteraceae bacterium]|nr:hypothetical protein [Caulobacteraceae bacterium]
MNQSLIKILFLKNQMINMIQLRIKLSAIMLKLLLKNPQMNQQILKFNTQLNMAVRMVLLFGENMKLLIKSLLGNLQQQKVHG